MAFPFSSTATHSETDAHETAGIHAPRAICSPGGGLSALLTRHADGPPEGSFDAITLPDPSLATHSDIDGMRGLECHWSRRPPRPSSAGDR